MSKSVYEVEIKSLLGSKENANKLLTTLHTLDPKLILHHSSTQLNHYFLPGDFEKLLNKIQKFFNPEHIKSLEEIVHKGFKHSLRTRKSNTELLLVLKANRDNAKSNHEVIRYEFENSIENMSIEELDELILSCDFKYQSKWSRERKEYKYKDINICIDKNAGYGYLAELEKIVEKEEDIETNRNQLLQELKILGIEEIALDRIERMFDYYNKNWPEYYGTDKVFTIL